MGQDQSQRSVAREFFHHAHFAATNASEGLNQQLYMDRLSAADSLIHALLKIDPVLAVHGSRMLHAIEVFRKAFEEEKLGGIAHSRQGVNDALLLEFGKLLQLNDVEKRVAEAGHVREDG